MTIKRLTAIGTILFITSAGSGVFAQRISISPTNLNQLVYDASQEASEAAVITLENRKKFDGDYFIAFSPGPTGRVLTSGVNSLPYMVYSAATAPRDELLDEPSADGYEDVLSGTFTVDNDTKTHNVYIILAPGGWLQSGTYTGTLTATWYAGVPTPGGHGAVVKSKDLSIRAQVDTILSMSIVPVNAPFEAGSLNGLFSFGTLTDTPATQSADLVARGNVPFAISVSSANNNALYHKQGDTSSTIPYTVNIAGYDYTSLSSTPTQFTTQAATGEAGVPFTITVTVSLPASEFPSWGDYEDSLTFSIAAN